MGVERAGLVTVCGHAAFGTTTRIRMGVGLKLRDSAAYEVA